jgi:hypothetical protein
MACHLPSTGMKNSAYDYSGCLSCKECAHLLTRHEALKREQARIESRPGECASQVSEIVAKVAESRKAYTRHWAIHRGTRMPSSNIAGHCSCASL